MKSIKLPFLLQILIIFTGPSLFGNVFSNYLINQNYSEYIRAVDTIKSQPCQLLLKSVFYTQFMIDYYSDVYEDSLRETVDEAKEINTDNDTANFVKGGVYLNYAFYLQFKGDIWEALNYGNRGIGYLKKVNRNSPFYNDALLGVAIYDYGVGKLFFRKKKTEEGMKELNYVSKNGDYFGMTAENLKILLFYNEGDYKRGIKESLALLGKYPDSRLVLWDIVKGFKYQKSYDSLTIYGLRLAANLKNDSIPNNYNLLSVYDLLIDAYVKTDSIKSAEITLNDVKRLNIRGDYIHDAQKLRESIIKRYRYLLR